MDILGENAGMFLWKYGGMTSAAVGALTTLTLVVLNALNDSGSGQFNERQHDDENANRQTIGNDHLVTDNFSNDTNQENIVNGFVNYDPDDDFNDEGEMKENNKQHHSADESLVAAASNGIRRRSKKKYFSK